MMNCQEINNRKIIWHAMSDLFLDTDVNLSYENIVIKCASSIYFIDELYEILISEVAPACSFNLYDIAGEWAGFDEEWLEQRIVKVMHRKNSFFSKLYSSIGNSMTRKYVDKHWNELLPKILEKRNIA